jgi:hypothetical protein
MPLFPSSDSLFTQPTKPYFSPKALNISAGHISTNDCPQKTCDNVGPKKHPVLSPLNPKLLPVIFLLASFPAFAQQPPPTKLPPLLDLNQTNRAPSAATDTKATALIFILPDCPICNSYIPELNRLHQSLSPRGIQLVLVHADNTITAEQARQHAREYKIASPIALDPRHDWVKLAAATTAPEAALFSPSGDLLYRGRIDNQYAGPGQRRAVVTSRDLLAACEAILAGQPIATPRTPPIGCPIPALANPR